MRNGITYVAPIITEHAWLVANPFPGHQRPNKGRQPAQSDTAGCSSHHIRNAYTLPNRRGAYENRYVCERWPHMSRSRSVNPKRLESTPIESSVRQRLQRSAIAASVPRVLAPQVELPQQLGGPGSKPPVLGRRSANKRRVAPSPLPHPVGPLTARLRTSWGASDAVKPCKRASNRHVGGGPASFCCRALPSPTSCPTLVPNQNGPIMNIAKTFAAVYKPVVALSPRLGHLGDHHRVHAVVPRVTRPRKGGTRGWPIARRQTQAVYSPSLGVGLAFFLSLPARRWKGQGLFPKRSG